jgi:hypothetical protein
MFVGVIFAILDERTNAAGAARSQTPQNVRLFQ